jgi:ADP-ribose pyrophosphatase
MDTFVGQECPTHTSIQLRSSHTVYLLSMDKSGSSKAKKARVISSRLAYKGPVFSVTTDQVEEPGGIRTRRDVVRHSGSIVVLAVEGATAVPRVLLERQYRHAAGQMMWELPAGRIDAGERELAAAKRELLEETGFTARRWKKILHFYVSPGFLDETMSIYLAQDLRPGIAQPEEDEKIETRFFPLSVALRMVSKGLIRDAKTIAGVLWLAQYGRKGC